jgi:hypothetical protein
MKVGDIVKQTSFVMQGNFDFSSCEKSPMEGKVIYIHPQGRYYILEFALRGGKVRESFKM